MAVIAEAYVHLKPFEVGTRLDQFAGIFERVAVYRGEQIFGFEADLDILLHVGTLKAKATVIASLGAALYAGVGNYGDFWDGIDRIVHQSRRWGGDVIDDFNHGADVPSEVIYRTERRLGHPGRIQRLLKSIKSLDSPTTHETTEAVKQEVLRVLEELDSANERELVSASLPPDLRPSGAQRDQLLHSADRPLGAAEESEEFPSPTPDLPRRYSVAPPTEVRRRRRLIPRRRVDGS